MIENIYTCCFILFLILVLYVYWRMARRIKNLDERLKKAMWDADNREAEITRLKVLNNCYQKDLSSDTKLIDCNLELVRHYAAQPTQLGQVIREWLEAYDANAEKASVPLDFPQFIPEQMPLARAEYLMLFNAMLMVMNKGE